MTVTMEQVERTGERLLDALVAGVVRGKAEGLTEDEIASMVEPHAVVLAGARELLSELLRQAHLCGVNTVHSALRRAPGVDREMLDEAAEYAAAERDE